MKAFDESKHPRDEIGQFTEKDLATAAIALGNTDFMKTGEYSRLNIAKYSDDEFGSTVPTDEEAKTYLRMSGVPPDLKADVSIYNSYGKIIVNVKVEGVDMRRSFKPDSHRAYNDFFKIDYDSRFKGQGAFIFNNQVDELRKQGYLSISTDAAKFGGYNGYYTWARLGYEPAYEDDTTMMTGKIGDYNQVYKTKARNFAELLGTKAGQDYWRVMGTDFVGRFDLTDGSYSMNTLKNYINERRKKANT